MGGFANDFRKTEKKKMKRRKAGPLANCSLTLLKSSLTFFLFPAPRRLNRIYSFISLSPFYRGHHQQQIYILQCTGSSHTHTHTQNGIKRSGRCREGIELPPLSTCSPAISDNDTCTPSYLRYYNYFINSNTLNKTVNNYANERKRKRKREREREKGDE